MGFVLSIVFWMIVLVVMLPILVFAPIPTLLFVGGFMLLSILLAIIRYKFRNIGK